LLLAVLLALAGCKTVQPAAHPQYAPPYPVLERRIEPIIRLPQKEPDMRLISTYQPKIQDQMRPGLQPPGGDIHVQDIFFQDVPLEIVAELLNELGGTNLMLQRAVAEQKVRLYLQDVSMGAAVEALLRSNELWFRTDGRVTAVMSEQAFADSMVFHQSEKIQAFFMRYTNAQDMAALLATILGPEVEFRDMPAQTVYGHLEAQVVGGSPGEPGEIKDLTAEERRKLVQIGEGETVQRLDEASSVLGRRLPAIITVFRKNNSIVVRSVDDGLLRHITGLIRELDTPVRQVLLEVRIVRLNLGDGFESFFDFTLDQRRHDLSTLGGVEALAATTLSYVFSTDQILARLQLFAERGRLYTIASPFLMSADNAEISFFVGRQVPLRTGVTREIIRGAEGQRDLVLFTPQIDNRELGTDLDIKSFINADQTITMEIVALIESANFNVSSVTLVNEITGELVTFPLDGVDKSQLRSILAVPTGNTVALGGFIDLEHRDFEQKVPLLGDIPVLGYLFKRVEREAARTETVILITPYVIGRPEDGPETTKRFLERGSQILEETDRAIERIIPEGYLFKPPKVPLKAPPEEGP
jgi:general secretion pathway protein D